MILQMLRIYTPLEMDKAAVKRILKGSRRTLWYKMRMLADVAVPRKMQEKGITNAQAILALEHDRGTMTVDAFMRLMEKQLAEEKRKNMLAQAEA